MEKGEQEHRLKNIPSRQKTLQKPHEKEGTIEKEERYRTRDFKSFFRRG
jgi:hypothetical protein